MTCGHQGSVAPASIARLKVNKHPVLVKASVTSTPGGAVVVHP